MEFLSQSQIDQYKDIIQQINLEFEKSAILEKALKDEDNQLIITRLSKGKLSERIFHIFVEIYHDISALLNVHEDITSRELEKLSKAEKCQFYFVEIYTSNAFTEKFQSNQNWILNISVRCNTGCISKSVTTPNISAFISGTWFILPVDENVIDSVVEVSLLHTSVDGKWLNLPLGKVHVDVSYHYQKRKDEEKNCSDAKLLQLAKMYSKDINIEQIRTFPYLGYNLPFNANASSFVRSLISNSYQKNDLEMFSELGYDSKSTVKLFLYTGVNKFGVEFDQQAQNLKIKGTVSDLYHIKKYMLKCMRGTKSLSKDQFFNKMKELLESKKFEGLDAGQSVDLYREIRKLWLELPL